MAKTLFFIGKRISVMRFTVFVFKSWWFERKDEAGYSQIGSREGYRGLGNKKGERFW
jgi:hypothetical protein